MRHSLIISREHCAQSLLGKPPRMYEADLGIYEACLRNGKSIPADVRFVSFHVRLAEQILKQCIFIAKIPKSVVYRNQKILYFFT